MSSHDIRLKSSDTMWMFESITIEIVFRFWLTKWIRSFSFAFFHIVFNEVRNKKNNQHKSSSKNPQFLFPKSRHLGLTLTFAGESPASFSEVRHVKRFKITAFECSPGSSVWSSKCKEAFHYHSASLSGDPNRISTLKHTKLWRNPYLKYVLLTVLSCLQTNLIIYSLCKLSFYKLYFTWITTWDVDPIFHVLTRNDCMDCTEKISAAPSYSLRKKSMVPPDSCIC